MENTISKNKNILVVLQETNDITSELRYLMDYFCGTIINDFTQISNEFITHKRIYVCGDIEKVEDTCNVLYVIKELSINYETCTTKNMQVVELGNVPIIISKAGVYFRNFFGAGDYFNKIKSEHEFQELTESNKESKALRKGIYLAEVLKEETKDKSEILHYRLLRCSSNLTGATDNFRGTDHTILDSLNDAVKYVFEKEIKLNHVLAQIYENKKQTDNTKEVKSKIKAHADKTKDMPKDGIIAFCTFYDCSTFEHLKPSETANYDWTYKQTSGLTRLHFKLKTTVKNDALEKEFSVTLYPNSVFLIPLSTNRLYTHEIKPSVLPIDKIPTRMGYVARCSKLEAVYMNNQTYLKENGALIKLEQMTTETMESLRSSYYEENKTEEMVEYGKIHFSMNSGDYKKPMY